MVISFIPSFQEYKTLQRSLQTFILCFPVYCSLCRYSSPINNTFIGTVLGLLGLVPSVDLVVERKVIPTVNVLVGHHQSVPLPLIKAGPVDLEESYEPQWKKRFKGWAPPFPLYDVPSCQAKNVLDIPILV